MSSAALKSVHRSVETLTGKINPSKTGNEILCGRNCKYPKLVTMHIVSRKFRSIRELLEYTIFSRY